MVGWPRALALRWVRQMAHARQLAGGARPLTCAAATGQGGPAGSSSTDWPPRLAPRFPLGHLSWLRQGRAVAAAGTRNWRLVSPCAARVCLPQRPQGIVHCRRSLLGAVSGAQQRRGEACSCRPPRRAGTSIGLALVDVRASCRPAHSRPKLASARSCPPRVPGERGARAWAAGRRAPRLARGGPRGPRRRARARGRLCRGGTVSGRGGGGPPRPARWPPRRPTPDAPAHVLCAAAPSPTDDPPASPAPLPPGRQQPT